MFTAPLMPTVIRDRQDRAWLYQYGKMYSDALGRTLRHRDSIERR